MNRNLSLDAMQFPNLDAQKVTNLITKCNTLPDNEQIVEVNNIPIETKTLRKILGESNISTENWLDDEAINAFISLLNAQFTSSYMFSTAFLKKYEDFGYNHVKNWTKPKLLKKANITFFDNLLIPLNPDENHWTVMIVDLRAKCFYYIDSIKKNISKEFVTDSVTLIKKWLVDEFFTKLNKRETFHTWPCIIVNNSPQQSNNKDCGVFMTRVSELIMGKKRIPTNFDDIPYLRKRMMIELYEKKLLFT